jgi:hypothetical protein
MKKSQTNTPIPETVQGKIDERIKIISPRIKFLTLHCLFTEGKNNNWMEEDEERFISRTVDRTQNLIDRHYAERHVGFKRHYFNVIYYREGLNDRDYQRMYNSRLRELDIQAGRKRRQSIFGSK